MAASAQVAQKWQGELAVEWIRDVDGLAALWRQLLDNEIAPSRGLMISLL